MTDQEKIISFLAKVPLFQDLKKRQLASLAKVVVERNYDIGETIVTQGEGGVGLFIVVSGKADAIFTDAKGADTVVNTFGPANYFGELALVDDGPRTASVVATEKTECLVITRWSFLPSLKGDADMTIIILQEITRRFRRALSTI